MDSAYDLSECSKKMSDIAARMNASIIVPGGLESGNAIQEISESVDHINGQFDCLYSEIEGINEEINELQCILDDVPSDDGSDDNPKVLTRNRGKRR